MACQSYFTNVSRSFDCDFPPYDYRMMVSLTNLHLIWLTYDQKFVIWLSKNSRFGDTQATNIARSFWPW